MTTRAETLDYRLDVVFPFDFPDVIAAAGTVVATLRSMGECLDPAYLYEELTSADRVGLDVAKKQRQTFNLSFPAASARLGRVRNYDHSFLQLDLRVAKDWRALVEALGGLGPIVTARLVISEFDYWQNAFDPLQFRTAGRTMAGLPMKSNGLPSPLDQMIVDTSKNPGRRVLRPGYVESIGHRMWLGAEYFRRVPGADRDSILRADWLRVTDLGDGLLEILAAEAPFTDDRTADIQDRLRRLLFPTTA